MGELWYEEGLAFSCLGCGRCCRGEPGAIWVTEEEIRALAVHLGMEEPLFRRRCLTRRWGRPSILERPNGDCLFLGSEGNRCTVYGLRPQQCRLFPFWPSVLRSREAWEAERQRCPGMGQGAWHSAEEIQEILWGIPFEEL